MTSPDLSHNSFPSEANDQWDPYEEPLDDPLDDPFSDPSQQQTKTNELKLCQLDDWDDRKIYDESYIRYSIEWKVAVNNRAIIPKDTEQDIVLAPAAYWQRFLEPKLEDSVRKTNRSLKAAFTSVVVSVTQRKEPDLARRFDNTSIDWAVIESQLVTWRRFYCVGKKLRLNLSFNYTDTTNTALRSGDKRGFASTTRQMLAIGGLQVDAEQHSSGQASVWRKVYKTMRCPGPPCNKGPYCWIDAIGKKHYKLLSDTMESLVEYVQDGNILETHDDVPHDIRQQLYNEEETSVERHKKKTTTSAATPSPIPITITVLPAPSSQASLAGTQAPDVASLPKPIYRLDTSGFRDDTVKEYCAWQQEQVKDPTQKVEYQKACDVILQDGMSLELIRRDPNPQFLIDGGVKKGPSLHIVGDIDYWFENVKRARIE
jgi:hypothetical protein